MIAALIYPHQLFPDPSWMRGCERAYFIEDPLLFAQYNFHRQKRMLHRASMQWYADQLRQQNLAVQYVACDELRQTSELSVRLALDGVRSCRAIDPEDHDLRKRLTRGCRAKGIELQWLPDPNFLTPVEQIDAFVRGKSKLHFTNFYIEQRKRLGILVDRENKPLGGKWSFDPENRRRLPAGHVPPLVPLATSSPYAEEARRYVEKHFPGALGEPGPLWYPHDSKGADHHLETFLRDRFSLFGDYEDAISQQQPFLYHSVLTPMMNIGLLAPQKVLERALARASDSGEPVPLNSLEGFVRQILGWREYMRLVYRSIGVEQRTRNYWSHTRPLPPSFYDGTTGIVPVDHAIRTVLKYGYCHHIERLMILGNFMLLCEFAPDAIYRWFMEMFVDAYDWVMVPNVYGMSQYADGGRITTKPYISGSSYVLKMSDFKKGAWCGIWDSLYWRFMAKHRPFFESNPRTKVLTGQLDRMGAKLTEHQRTADLFLESL